MLTLLTSNPAKYAPFASQLERLRIQIEPPRIQLPEVQSLNFAETLAAKAKLAAESLGRPVLVDDAGLVLDAYPSFPGPLSSVVIRTLGVAGLQRLLDGLSTQARMECHIGGWFNGALHSWQGKVQGRLDFSRKPKNERMILTDIFVPDAGISDGMLLHRERALSALGDDIFELHLEARAATATPACVAPVDQCVFCDELWDETHSVFAEVMGGRLDSRVIYQDEHFVVMPPLGQFMEGGLLLLLREHIQSFAYLPPERYDHLERLVQAICKVLEKHYGTPPLVFEHGPATQWSKGGCCVDHAHLNIFPARVDLHPHLAGRMSMKIDSLDKMRKLRQAEFGYLFIQENDGCRRAYDAQNVPAQLVRRIITAALGRPERGDWRDYPGRDELIATYNTLRGKITL